MKLPHFSITQSGLIAAATSVISLVVADVPSWAPYKATLISDAGIGIGVVFMLANGIHYAVDHFSTKGALADVEQVVKAEVGKINVNGLVQDALKLPPAEFLTLIEKTVEDDVEHVLAAKAKALGSFSSGGVVPPSA